MAKKTVNFKFEHTDYLYKRLTALKNTADAKYRINKAFAKMCEPYVPCGEGDKSGKHLATNYTVTEKGVTYNQDYARYQYYGKVYGPNLPMFDKLGNLIGFHSIAGKKKRPTGKLISYRTDIHPLATSYWDKAMMRDNSKEFSRRVKIIVVELRL